MLPKFDPPPKFQTKYFSLFYTQIFYSQNTVKAVWSDSASFPSAIHF